MKEIPQWDIEKLTYKKMLPQWEGYIYGIHKNNDKINWALNPFKNSQGFKLNS